MENIDETILQNMGDLSSVIGRSPYVTGSPDQLPEGVNLSGVGDPNMPRDAAQYLGNVADPGMSGMTPQVGPGPGMDPGERQRLEQVAYDASMARIDAEEQAFQVAISGYSDEDKERFTLARELEQTREVNEWLNAKLQGNEQQQQQQASEGNKRKWLMVVATQTGLPLANQAVTTALLKAQNVQEMYTIANGLTQLVGGGQAQSAQRNMNSGILAAGGRPMPSSPQGPKRSSGDIAGLIGSRGAVSVNMG
jgi:hypothetical protein